jgi:NADH-quinone oxidoreductase subunit L
MEYLLYFFIALPLTGFFASLFIPERKESTLSYNSYFFNGVHLLCSQLFFFYFLLSGHQPITASNLVILKTPGYEFFVSFGFDKITGAYLFVGSILTFLVTMYSRYYLHREPGYKRFFNTIQFFYVGYNIIIFAGNLETMFIGWEIIGISSFLLIAFYRNRYLPVKNATKVFSLYRVGDVGFILAMWMTHHLFHENVTFQQLSDYTIVHEHMQSHTWIGVFISLMLLVSAAVKSGQFPFSSWVPRAMEGPTPSSAIFYGSLSVNIGVFLMLRTFPFWEHQFSVRVLIGLMGFVTTIITTGIARVQSSIKSQVAYSSLAQIGLIFIEVALGLQNMALIHFAGNAFLRTYQLLVSPSVVSYLIREQFYNFSPRETTIEDSFPKKIRYSLYMLCVKEWNLDSFMYAYLWNPLKWAGNKLNFLTLKKAMFFFIPVYLLGLFLLFNQHLLSASIIKYLPNIVSVIGVITVLKSFSERQHARLAWTLVVMNHFWVALAISFNELPSFHEINTYLLGVTVAGLIGYRCLRRIKTLEGNIDLNLFHGHSFKRPLFALVFLLCCLGVSGFPITPSFIGEDLIFSHIHEDQIGLAFFSSLSMIIDGIAIVRIYARVFLGPHEKSMYEMAYRSS